MVLDRVVLDGQVLDGTGHVVKFMGSKWCPTSKVKKMNNNGDFWKILFDENSDSLALPPDAATNYFNDVAPNHPVTIYYSEEKNCPVNIGYVDGVMSFTQGWSDVVNGVPLRFGYFVVFNYVNDARYKIDVYHPNGCNLADLSDDENVEDEVADVQEDGGAVSDDDVVFLGSFSGANNDGDADERFFEAIVVAHDRFRIPQKLVDKIHINESVKLLMVYEGQPGVRMVVRREMSAGRRRYNLNDWPVFRTQHGINVGDEIKLKYDFDGNALLVSHVVR